MASEKKLQSELDLSRSSRSRTDNPGCRRLSSFYRRSFWGRAGAINHWVRRCEVGVVEHVEKLRAELCAPPLMDRGPLGQRQVQLRKSRPGQRIAAETPERSRVRRTEGSRVEPLLHCLGIERPTKAGSKIGTHGVARIPVAGRVVAQLRREGETALQGRDPTQLPAVHKLAGR